MWLQESKIEKGRLGKTGHMSSIVILGGYALAHIDKKKADAALELALDNGINHIDVAPMYGQAESRIGTWIKRNGKKFFLACKTVDRDKKGAWESIKRSLDRLSVDSLDLFQLHGVDKTQSLKTALGHGGAMGAILEAKQQGLLRYIGITGHVPPV
jgi:aryl-alcohol dehydrogenase-like predicted oxidoreductase